MEPLEKLVARVIEGDKRAFAEIYDQYAPFVRAVCYDHIGDADEAEDMAQEAFLRAYRQLGKLRQPARFGSWLITIAKRIAMDRRRQRLRDRHQFMSTPPEPLKLTDSCTDPLAGHLLDAIGQLPERERMALHMFYLSEQPAELARQVIGLSSSGFYRLLERARQSVAAILETSEEVTDDKPT